MNSLDILKKELLYLPKENDNTTSFLDFIRKTLSDYLTCIMEIDTGTIVEKLAIEIPAIQKLCDSIIDSFEKLYLGFPNQSYLAFAEGMKAIEPYIMKQAVTHPLSETRLYIRARYSENLLSNKEMFHIPFDLRENSTTQRFSIPGFPCLYLASSSYTCWEELNRPKFENFYVSRYEISDPNSFIKLRTLDISHTPQRVVKMIETALTVTGTIDSWDPLSLNYLVKWPLIFASSIKVRYGNRTFKPEYVIPQYLLIWARENGRINAIKYFSVKTHLAQNIDSSSFWNVVVPVREIKNEGFCSALVDIFKLTDPLCMKNIDDLIPKASKDDLENYITGFHPEWSPLLSPLKEFSGSYIDSKFGRADVFLCRQNVTSLK